MRLPTNFAQATQAPNNGGSNAADFQPPTRNPQSAPAELQPVDSTQEASNQDILNRQNVRINVPVNPADPLPPRPLVNGGINWVFVVVSTAVIVGVLYYLMTLRDKRKAARTASGASVPPEEVVEEPIVAAPAAEAPKPPTPTPPKKSKKKKSKSKRKNR